MDGRKGYVICAQCGQAGHTMGSCRYRRTAATTSWAGPTAADVPRRCRCGAATLHCVDGLIVNDGHNAEHTEHRCAYTEAQAA